VLWIARPLHKGESLAELRAEHEQLQDLFRKGTPVRCVAVHADAIFDALAQKLGVHDESTRMAAKWQDALARSMTTAPWHAHALGLAGLLHASGRVEQARSIYGQLDRTRLPVRERALVAVNYASASYRVQDYRHARAAARRAVRLCRLVGDQEGQAHAYGLLGLIAERSSERQDGWPIRYMRMSAALHARGPRSRHEPGALLDIGIWLKNRGRFAEANGVLRTALRKARNLGAMPDQMRIHLAIGILRGYQRHRALAGGEFAHGRRLAASSRYHLRRAAEAAGFLGVTADEIRALEALIALELDSSGRHFRREVTKRLVVRAERLARVSPEPDQQHLVAILRGEWLNRIGRRRDAVVVFTEVVDRAGSNRAVSEALRERARAYLALGEAEAAETDLLRANTMLPEGPRRASNRGLLAQARALQDVERPERPTAERRRV
jgi:tetratricopeptide (TPR) repeat protein